MIVTVTLNPAIDKTIDVDHLEVGGLNRIKRVEYDAGGKGINVSKTIAALGGESIATGFLGGNEGKRIELTLNNANIKSDFVWVDGETRTNTKVFDKKEGITELNEPGFTINEENIAELMGKLESYAAPDVLFVLAGSIPKGVPYDIYYKIINMVHEKGGKVLLDADGDLFVKALDAVPDIIKPNRFELEQYVKLDHHADLDELVSIAKDLIAKGVSKIAISLGGEGAVMIGKDYVKHCPGLTVKCHSTVGAGDAMVAGLSYSYDKKLELDDEIRLCIAVSAGAVTTMGTKPPERKLVDLLVREVKIHSL